MRHVAPAFLLLLCVGCGGGGKAMHTVSGKVTLEDGTAITTGSITFSDGKESYRGGIDKEGKFSIEAPEGSFKVAIVATESTGGDSGHGGETKQLVDSKFGTAETSGLVYVVKGAASDADFKVTAPQ